MLLPCGGVHQQVPDLLGPLLDVQGGGESQGLDGRAVGLGGDELLHGWHGDGGGRHDGRDGPGEQIGDFVVTDQSETLVEFR